MTVMRLFLLFLVVSAATAAPCIMPDKSCTEKLTAGEGRSLLIYRTLPLTQRAPGVQRAFILVHGTGRNGDDYFKTAVETARESGALEQSIVIAPQFRGNDGERCKDRLDDGELGFPCNGWKDGQPASNASIDSFGVMDLLLKKLDDKSVFANLKEIVVAGHSAGGQYVQRYAAVNRIEADLDTPVRYIVANPSSYLYLEPWRPVSDPATACPDYNKYKYGLVELSGYAWKTGGPAVRRNYPKRNVTYLLGQLDDKDSNDLDKTCPAVAQGPNRLERGLAYHKRLTETFSTTHKLVIIPGCGHSADCMYRSEPARKVVFP